MEWNEIANDLLARAILDCGTLVYAEDVVAAGQMIKEGILRVTNDLDGITVRATKAGEQIAVERGIVLVNDPKYRDKYRFPGSVPWILKDGGFEHPASSTEI